MAFPELVLTGYPPEDLLFKPAFIEANLRALADVARASRGLTAVVGFVDKRDDIFNAAAVLHDGAQAGTYHKQYLPNYGVFDENRYFQSGTESPVFALGETVIAVNICEDIWYPTGPTTLQALAGAELVVTINASPYHAGKAQLPREDAGHARRRRPRVPGLRQHGRRPGRAGLRRPAFIFNEKGECVARGQAFEEDFVVADLDLDEVFRARLHDSRRRKEKLRRHRGASRRVALPPLPAPRAAASCRAHEVAVLEPVEEIYQALVLGTRDYVTKNGFTHVVLGLSGGIDSSLWRPSPWTRSGAANVTGVPCPRRSPRRHAGGRGAARPEPRHRVPAAAHHAGARRPTSARSPSPSRGSRRT